MTGNGLAVFLHTADWSTSAMQRMTREMRQFESIFLSGCSPSGAAARIFTVDEELPFAGHPVLGAAAVLHRTQAPNSLACAWTLRLPYAAVPVTTSRQDDHYLCEMNQGQPIIGTTVSAQLLGPILKRLGVRDTDTVSGLPAQVISTGLPYLIIPVTPSALAHARIEGTDLESLLGAVGAKFVLLLDSMHRRHAPGTTWGTLKMWRPAAPPGRPRPISCGTAARRLPYPSCCPRVALPVVRASSSWWPTGRETCW